MTPPRVPRWLIARRVDADRREFVLGDLEEEFEAIVAERGPGPARRWYWHEALRVALGRSRRAPARLPAPAGDRPLASLLQDLRYAVRLSARSPGFTAVAVLTLALGIGVNTAMFSVVHAVLLAPLPYPSPDRLVRVFDESPRVPRFPVSPANFLDYRDRAADWMTLAAYTRSDLQLAEADHPEQLHGMRVSAGYFRVVGRPPVVGREFARRDEARGAARLVILSYDLWQRRFQGDRSIVGRAVDFSGRAYEVVGVAPRGFRHVGGDFRTYAYGERVDAWTPLTFEPGHEPRGQHYLNVVGRLAGGLPVTGANERLGAIGAELAALYPGPNRDWRARCVALADTIVGPARPMLLLLAGAVTLVLLIACANVAGLLVARLARRAKETAVRAAIGASRGRIVRQLAVESAVLATAGAVLGLGVAAAAVRALIALGPDVPRLQTVSLDTAVLAYAGALAAVTVLVFGLAPAARLAGVDLNATLKEGGERAGAGPASRRLRRLLVVAQIALAFVLLAGTGLLVRSFANLVSTDPGFRADGVLTLGVTLPPARYPHAPEVASFFTRLLRAADALPEVTLAGAGNSLPWTGYDENSTFGIVGRTFPPEQLPRARYHFVTPDYLATLGVPVLDGRAFAASDDERAPLVALMNEAAARRYWGGAGVGDPVGARIDLFGDERTVVGVVGDVKDTPWAAGAVPAIYMPFRQVTTRRELFVAIRGRGAAAGLAGPIRRAMRSLDPALPVWDVRPLEAVVERSFAERTFTLWLVGAFTFVAFALAVIGIYGVVAQLASARVAEFGVRRALGASTRSLLALVLGDGVRLALVGLVVGVAAALAVSQTFASLLYDVSPSDPWTLAAAGGLLLVAAAAGGYAPARRASRVDPAATLRAE